MSIIRASLIWKGFREPAEPGSDSFVWAETRVHAAAVHLGHQTQPQGVELLMADFPIFWPLKAMVVCGESVSCSREQQNFFDPKTTAHPKRYTSNRASVTNSQVARVIHHNAMRLRTSCGPHTGVLFQELHQVGADSILLTAVWLGVCETAKDHGRSWCGVQTRGDLVQSCGAWLSGFKQAC